MPKPAVGKDWRNLKNLLASDFKHAEPKAVVRPANSDRRTCAAHPTYKGRVVLPRDNAKDDEGHKAVFTEQGVSAWQQQNSCRTFSRLLGIAGEANDAVSAYTQVLVSEALRLLRIQEKACPQVWIRLPPSRRPNLWDSIEETVVPFERKHKGHPFAGLLLGKKIETGTLETNLGKGADLECLHFH